MNDQETQKARDTEPQAPPETRERILLAALHLFSANGYNTVSMREVAAAAEISKPMLYYYFESKQGLLEALLDSALKSMQRAIDRIITSDSRVDEKLRMITRMRFQLARDNPDMVKLFLDALEDPGLKHEVRRFLARGHKMLGPIADLVRTAQQQNVLRDDLDPWLVPLAIMGITGMYVHLSLSFWTDAPELSDELADQVCKLVMEGAQPRPSAPKLAQAAPDVPG